MSNLQQICENEKLNSVVARYSSFPNTSLFVGDGYTFLGEDPMCVNSAAAIRAAGLASGRVPASYNPSGQLMAHGVRGLTLASPFSQGCDSGCVGFSSDPRNKVVKPLYTMHVYSGTTPSVNTVTGMYP